jgi:hypothetical protein
MEKNKIILLLIIIIFVYLSIGFIFTILRANSHYNYFILQPDTLQNNGKSYWENRCIEENKENPIPIAQWCVDGNGKFHTEKPSKISWYFMFYSKKVGDFFFLLIFWWLQFFGIELINFRGVGYFH